MTVDEWNKIYIAKDGTFLTEKLVEEAYEIINRQKAEIEKMKEAVKEFGHFLIEKEKKGRIYTMDIPDYVQEFIIK